MTRLDGMQVRARLVAAAAAADRVREVLERTSSARFTVEITECTEADEIYRKGHDPQRAVAIVDYNVKVWLKQP